MLTRKFYLAIFIFLFIAGCNNPDSVPEERDFVYKDLRSEESKTKKEIDAKTKELGEMRASYLELPDNDYQKKLTRADIYKTEKEISKLKQKMSFYKISAESRQIYARKEYLEYFKQGKEKEWPLADTKVLYEKQKLSAGASKQWMRGIAAAKTQAKEEKKAPASGH